MGTDANEPVQLSFEDSIDPQTSSVDADEAEVSSQAGLVSYIPQLGVADFDSEDVAWPRLRLAQGLSVEVQNQKAKAGQWTVIGHEARDKVVVVPLGYMKRRELTDEDFQVLCASAGGVTGVGVPGGPCLDCPMNVWTGEKGARKPPKCNMIYSYIVYDVETDNMARIEFKKTGLTAGRQLNTMMAQNGPGKFAISLESRSQTARHGAYYIPFVARAELTPEARAAVETILKGGV